MAGSAVGVALIGESQAMTELRAQVARFAPLGDTVLITGPTGSGKELVAQALHAAGPRRARPLVPLNCAALPESLAESELFGHRRGAFTGAVDDRPGLFAATAGGTLFLDEINSLSLRLQGMLLRVLETGEYRRLGEDRVRHSDVRLLCASNEDLEEAAAAGRFRRDLLFRLVRFTIRVPALHERQQDIPELVRHFIARHAGAAGPEPEPGLLAALAARAWPGNVRELRNEIERLLILQAGRPRLRAEGAAPLLARGPSSRITESSNDAPPASGIAAVPPGNRRARARRQRILALLARYPHLYRSDVLAHIACAPRTATADLAALEAAGLLRRVVPARGLNGSYFVAGPGLVPERSS